jgi:hypothetical protein
MMGFEPKLCRIYWAKTSRSIPRSPDGVGDIGGLGACQCGPVEWTKLAIAVSDVDQAPKVENLA